MKEIEKKQSKTIKNNHEELQERSEKQVIENRINTSASPKFWQFGNTIYSDSRIILRKVEDEDMQSFLALQYEYTLIPFMFKDERFKQYLWEEHIKDVSIAYSIIDSVTKVYMGYCGIKNISLPQWEISMELQKSQTGKGIGYLALGHFLNAVKERSGVSEFRVRIDSDNYASQKLVEKLGAVPNGISEFLLHDEEDILKCEEDNLNCIDEKLIAVAKKFGVEPRKLISHVLEYKLIL